MARFGLLAWFFGNLYEGLVGVPQLVADARPRRPPGRLTIGSPVRYFVPVAAVALGPTGITLTNSWRAGGDRRVVVATAMCVGSALALSAHLIRTINIPLLVGHEPLTPPNRAKLVTRWQRGNAVRLVALAGAIALIPRLRPTADTD